MTKLVWHLPNTWSETSTKVQSLQRFKVSTCSFTLNNDCQTFSNYRLFHDSTCPTFCPSIHYALSSWNNNQNWKGIQHYMWWDINERTIHKLFFTLKEQDSPIIWNLVPYKIFSTSKGYLGEGNGTPLQYSCLENPTPVLLPGKSHGWRSLVGCSPWVHWATSEWPHFHFSLSCTGEGNGNPLQCSCLENPRDGGAWWAAVYGVTQSWTQRKRLSSSCSSIEHLDSNPNSSIYSFPWPQVT